MKKEDGMVEWKGLGQIGQWASCARVRVYENDGMQICVAEEPEDYDGSPLKDCSATAAGLAIQKFSIDFQKFVWIERAVVPGIKFAGVGERETFHLCIFQVHLVPNPLSPKTPKARFMSPERFNVTKKHVEALIGEPLS